MFKKQSLIILFFIIFCSFALAVDYGYTLELGDYHDSTDSIIRSQFIPHSNAYELCSGEQKIIPIWIKNTLEKDNTFTLKLNAPKYAKLTSSSFTLPSKKSGVTFLVLEPKLGLEDETTLYLDIIPSQGTGSRTPILLKVNDCYDFELKLAKNSDSLCACESKDYTFSIENNGIDTETFDLEISGLEYASLGSGNLSQATIMQDTISDFNFNVDLPCEITEGNYQINVKASLTEAGVVSEDKFNLKTYAKEKCFSLNVPMRDITISQDTKEYNFKIKNTGLRNADYDVSLESPEWISLGKDIISINKGQTENLNLLFLTNNEVEAGDYSVTLTFQSENDEFTKSFNVKLNQENQIFASIKEFMTFYKYYFITAFVLLLIIIVGLVVLRRKQKPKKKKEKKTKEEAIEEKPKKEPKETQESTLPKIPKKLIIISEIIIIAVAVIAAIIYSISKFGISFVKIKNLFYIVFIPVRDFISLYLYYFIIGIALLAIIIFVLNKFYKDK